MAWREADEVQALAGADAALIARSVPSLRRDTYRPRPARTVPVDTRPELGPVLDLLAPGVAIEARQRADLVGTGADRVLVARGHLDEETYARRLARATGLRFETLGAATDLAPLPAGGDLIEAAASGVLTMRDRTGTPVFVVALDDQRAGRLLADREALVRQGRLRITTRARLRAFVESTAPHRLAARAVAMHRAANPDASASGGRRVWPWVVAPAMILAVLTIMSPDFVGAGLAITLSLVFLIHALFRAASALTPRRADPPPVADDRRLPVYSILVPLYREARCVPQLVTALRALDYPPEKLDIQFVVEADDRTTIVALHAARPDPFMAITVAPTVGPRTKPKALNAALGMARGSLLAIYDAEDRPEPDQLRKAAAAFATAREDLACVQASLVIDNTRDNLLTRLFTLDYGSLFEVVLPFLARFNLPILLGGTSNHFRVAVLRELGGWDPFNVTEDADLGLRLARAGYRVGTIRSATFEEAPAGSMAWLKQRTRWYKGWMQTWGVHMRAPGRLAHDLGWRGFLTVQVLLGVAILSSLVHPVSLGLLVVVLASATAAGADFGPSGSLVFQTTVVACIGGHLSAILVGAVALCRRPLDGAAPALLLIPLHWFLLGLAAWRALIQLFRSPSSWEKTEHGLARTSRVRDQR
jgi:hypothetical protein